MASKSVDELSIHYFELLEDVEKKQERLNLAMKEGFFNLTRARMDMGADTVSAHMIPPELTATTKVKIQKQDKRGDTTINVLQIVETKQQQEQQSTSSNKLGDSDKSNNNNSNKKKEEQDTSSSTKQQPTTTTTDENGKEQQKNKPKPPLSIYDRELEDKLKARDPVFWFGVTASSSIRKAQQFFKQALEHIAEIANLRQEMEAIQQQYLQQLQQQQQSTK